MPEQSPVLLGIFHQRGLTEPSQIYDFLAITEPETSPFKLKGVGQAVTRIRRALKAGETIAVYGDFDVDGVTATALLVTVLRALGGTANPYIPNRIDEGYGLNRGALKSLREGGTTLVVTVDCGIRSTVEVDYAKQIGLDLIVSDHHSVGPELPPAEAVINPKQPDCSYPFKSLAGVGIAFKLAHALLMVEKQTPLGRRAATSMSPEDLLDLVALGTVADIVPLIGENRLLVSRGLKHLNQPRRVGLQSLISQTKLKPGKIRASNIAFQLGPRLNAAGRLDSGMLGFDLLTASDARSAVKLAAKMDSLNRKRQDITERTFEQAQKLAGDDLEGDMLLAVGSDDFHPGILGLVASKLSESYYRPAVVMTIGPETTRGSARSIPEFHITRALDRCRPLLVRHGGHAAAAGFTVENDNRPALLEQLKAIATEELQDMPLHPSMHIDAEVTSADLTFDLWQQLNQLEPCGHQNETAVFCIRDTSVESWQTVGADGAHLKLRLNAGNGALDAIAFRQAAWADHLPPAIDVAFTLDVNEWNGRRRLQLIVKDIHPAGSDDL